MMKRHLNLEREAQLRDYDRIISHTNIAIMYDIFLAVEQRCHHDKKPLEVYLLPARGRSRICPCLSHQRLLAFVFDKVRSSWEFAEHLVIAVIDTIMGAAVEFIEKSRRLATNKNEFSMG